MIQTVYTDNTKKNEENVSIKLPKNIRQIGQSNSDYQIYVEDTVMNFLKKKVSSEESIRYGILLGNVKYGYGYTYIFINAAVEVEEIMENAIIFSDEIWEELNQKVRKYFDDLRVVGWFSSLEYGDSFDMSYAAKIHLYNFGGLDKIYLKIDRDEDDETFYTYSENGFVKQGGYHIYFDRNMRMDEYMVSENMPVSVEKGEKKTEGIKKTIVHNNIRLNKESIEKQSEKASKELSKKATKLSKKIMSNIASVLLVATLVGAVAIVSNENSMNKIKTYMNNLIYNEDKEKESKEYRIPVNGMVDANQTIRENSESATTELGNIINNETQRQTNGGTNESLTGEENTSEISTTDNSLNIPKETETNQMPTETATVQSVIVDVGREYVVQKGDTLTLIATKMYGDKNKVKDIMQANDIENADYVEVGDKLYLP